VTIKYILRSFTSLLAVCLTVFAGQGAMAAETQLTPSISVRYAYNDNVFFERVEAKSDSVFTITPAMDLDRRTERIDANLRFEFPIIRYLDMDELDAVDQTYAGSMRYEWSPRMTTSLQARYIVDSQPERDMLETGLVIGDTTRRRFNAGFSGRYVLSEAAFSELSYAYAEERFADRDFTDIESHQINLRFARNMARYFSNTDARITFGGSRYDFESSHVDSFSAMVGFVRALAERYSLSVEIGGRYTRSEFEFRQIQWITPETFRIVTARETEDGWGVVGRASLSYQGEANRASLGFSRDINTSGGRTGTVERSAVVLDVGRRFTRTWWINCAAGYYLNESKRGEFALQEIDQETWRVSPYLQYNPTPNLSAVLSYTYTRVNYKIDDTNADRNLVFLRISYAHPLF
jgi:hypothetical protein